MATYWNALCDRLDQAWQEELHLLGEDYEKLCRHAEALGEQLEPASRDGGRRSARVNSESERPDAAGAEIHLERLIDEHRETWREVTALRNARRKDAAVAASIKALWNRYERDIRSLGVLSGCHESNRAHVAGTFRLAVTRMTKGAGRPKKKFVGADSIVDPASINRVAVRHRFGSGGVTVHRCFSNAGGAFHLEHVPADAYQSNVRAARHRRLTSGELRLRTGTSGESRSYLVVPFRGVLHRPLPRDGIVKLVQLTGRRSFGTWSWRLNITLEQPPPASSAGPDRRPIAGLDLNWRHIEPRSGEGVIRFGAVVDSTGEQYFLTLALAGRHTRRRFSDHADLAELQRRGNELLERTKLRLSTLLAGRTDLAEPLAAWVANIMSMGRRGLLMGLSLFEQHGVAPEAQSLLRSQWLVEEERIRKRISRLSEYLVNRRTHLYRNIAAALCRRYRIIAIKGDFDLSTVSRTQRFLPRDEWRNGRAIAFKKGGRYRQWAAAGAFARCLELAARKHGTTIFKGTGAFVTVTHHECGHLVSRARDIELYCDRCAVTFDQDINAASNLMSQITP